MMSLTMNAQQKIAVSILLALAPSFALAELAGGNTEPQVACRTFGGVSEQVCPTSFIRLIARPEALSGKTVAVQGWPKKLHGRFYLFLDKGSADNNMMENALVCASGCERLASRVGVRTTLIGGFSNNVSGNDLFGPVGEIRIKLIREID